MAQAQEVFLFQPTSITGCQLWIDAADSSTVTLSSGSISAVSDKSGNGYNLTGGIAFTYNTTLFQGRYPSFFNTSSAADGKIGSNASFNLNQPMTVFATGVMSVGNNDMIFDGNTKRIALYNSTANLFAGPDSQIFTSTNYLLSPYVVCGVANVTNSAVFVNGTSVVSGTIGTDPLTSIVVGNRTGGSGSPYRGHLCEFIIFNSSLTTVQRQQVEGYLAWKWGLQGSLPSNHPFKNYRPLANTPIPVNVPNMPIINQTVAVFSPTQISGCQLWLDASDPSTFSLSGSTLVSWADKSGTNKTITVNSAPTYSSTGFNTSYPAFTFTSSTYLSTSLSSAIAGGNCAFIAVWRNTTTNAQNGVLTLGVPGSGSDMGLGWNNGETRYKFYQYASGEGHNTAVGNNTNVILIGTKTSSVMACFANGYPPVSTAGAVDNFQTALYIGTNVPGWGFGGPLCEIILYVGTLNTTQRQQLEGYLAWKWGLVGSLIPGHPYKQVPIAPFPYRAIAFNGSLSQWQPTRISGCQLWLDATDPNGNGIAPSNGTSVSTWVDKSGSGNNATVQVGTPTFSSNGVVFTGTQMYQTPLSSVNNTQTFFAIMSFTSTNFMNIVGVKAQVYNNGYQYAMTTNQQFVSRFGGTSIVTGATLPQNTQSMYGAIINGGSTSFLYSNGSQTGTAGATASVSGTATVTIGAHNDNPSPSIISSPFFGTINEIILYYAILTTNQRQQVEGYLAWKWGLQGSLPANHPFKLFPPPP